MHVRGAETQFRGGLPVGQVQTHEVEAQHPDPQRLVVPGQHCPAEVVKARRARLAAIPLPMRLRLVMPVPDHRVAVASRATDALWPAVLAHQGEALRVVEQGCQVDWVHCGHDDRNLSCSPATVDRLEPSSYPNPPSRASVTPEADKSQQQIDQLIAPIALYPDQLLAQVLMAATYPKQL